jgi:Leucine-rich repeat (LRR) protein
VHKELHTITNPSIWWESLSSKWQQAFSHAVIQKEKPSEEDLQNICNMTVLRLAGPTAPHSNCPVELTDLSGVRELKNLEMLVITHHAIESVEEISGLTNLKSLFLFNNLISSLKGIENLHQLEMLYVNSNELRSIKEIEQLTNLKELYVSDNRLTSLEGLTEQHADHLERFVCLPNKELKQKNIIYAERELGIMCR